MIERKITYPRRKMRRGLMRFLGRLILPLFFDIQVQGRQNFPTSGPLIVVGNHTAIMEVVQLFVFTPWQVEFLGGGDVPHELFTEVITRIVGYIPYQRGSMDRPALGQALSVLGQEGILGIFPEGGIWQTTQRSVQPGVAWLSEKAQAPVLPVSFEPTRGALGAAIKLKRPRLSMTIGELIPAAKQPKNENRKAFLHRCANQVMEAIDALAPAGAQPLQASIRDERFTLEITALNAASETVEIPADLSIRHPDELALLLHTPTVLKIFRKNLRLDIQPLQALSSRPSPATIAQSCALMLAYLAQQNPYLLSYRFGARRAEAMQLGLLELETLARWADGQDFQLILKPIRSYFDLKQDEAVVQTEQGVMENWM